MTEIEAMEIIKCVPLYRYECELEKGRQSDLFKALVMAIKALEKQIAKKPLGTTMAKDKDTSVGSIGKCPCCDSIVAEDMLWCDECGQKLDWE